MKPLIMILLCLLSFNTANKTINHKYCILKKEIKNEWNFNWKTYKDSIGYRESRNTYNISSNQDCHGRYQIQGFIIKKYISLNTFLNNANVQDSILYIYTNIHLNILNKYNKKNIPDSILLHSCHSRGIGNTLKKYKLKYDKKNN